MHLSELLDGLECCDAQISGIATDSRECKNGYLFIAIKGNKTDGNLFIDDALDNGAVAVITSLVSNDKRFIKCDDSQSIAGTIAAKFYSQPRNIAAVTGTNGKTSVVHFAHQILHHLGKKSATIGTLGINETSEKDTLTTPDAIALHKTLDTFTKDTYVTLEASSHGLEQNRLAGVNIQVAAITNISRDHLDYHKTYENYFQAKMRLFNDVMKNGVAVLNADIEEFEGIKKICKNHKIISYGKSGKDIKLLNVNGQEIQIEINNRTYNITTELIGEFQIYNLLCAVGIILAEGHDQDKVIAAMQHVTPATGRMELIKKNIVIDYAHTPDALEKALLALRPHAKEKLLLVFGCGGDRDKGKRALMGRVAEKLADIVIITDDNPRFEDPELIRKDIMKECKNGIEIADRKKAIQFAISKLNKNSLLLIAGKGHEQYQIIGNTKIPFNDGAVASAPQGGRD